MQIKSMDIIPNNMPQQLTSFVGREKEIAELKSSLLKTRLLTLTGSGGCGKTRLALQTAAKLFENYAQGVWLIDLAPFADPAYTGNVIASILGVKEELNNTILQTLANYLRQKTVLLILDNCEHLLASCALAADTLLRNCPGVTILATSRERLGISGELTYRVPSLSLPVSTQNVTPESILKYEAALIFVERAALHQSSFTVTSRNASSLISVCVRLDGIPLAIELAGARVRAMSIEEINSRLDNRFRLLTRGSCTALPRRRTLLQTIDWSYDLLTVQERLFLQRVSVFRGGWTLEGCEEVCSGGGDKCVETYAKSAIFLTKTVCQ